MAIHNNCTNCKKATACRLMNDIVSVLAAHKAWFTDPVEQMAEQKETLGKQCEKFVQNGA